MTTTIRGAASTLLAWGIAAAARADVAPDPGRPEWNDTPLPMPAEPSPELLAVTALMLAFAAIVWLRRGRA